MTVIYVLLIVFVLGACTTGANKTVATDKTGKNDTTSKTEATASAQKEPPAELSWFFHPQGTTWQEFDFSNNWFIDIIEEIANVKFTSVITPPHADVWTKFGMHIASGELMDLMYGGASMADLNKYGKDGAFLQVDNYIDNSPIISKVYNSAQREYIKAEDGKTYVIWGYPGNADFGTNEGFGYRADLLEKVGLDTPTTLDGWVDAMRKVKVEIPNTIPYSTVNLAQYYELMFSPFNIMFNYGTWIYNDESHTYTHAFDTENMVKALTFGRMLFKEGLLDNEFMTHTKSDYTKKIYSNNMFIVVKNRGGISGFITKYPANGVQGAKLLPSWYPAADGIDMKDGVYKHWGQLIGAPMVISSKTKSADACIRVIETLLSDKVRNLVVYGREGYEYEVVNGVKTPIQPAETDNGWRIGYGLMVGVNTAQRMSYKEDAAIDASPSYASEEKEAYKKAFSERAAKFTELVSIDTPRSNLYAAPLSDELSIKRSDSFELQKSLIAKTIMGDISIDEFRAEAKKVVANDADIVAAMNKLMSEAVKKYGLK